MEQDSLSVSMPSVRADISTTDFLKGDETCSGDPKTYGHSADYLPVRYSYIAPGKGGAYSGYSTNLPVLQDTGTGDQPEDINFDPSAEDGVLGLSSGCNNIASSIPSREAEESSTAGLTPSLSTNCLSERISKVRWENLSITEGAPLHYRALQFLINSVIPTDQSPQEGSDVKFNTNLRLTREAEAHLTWWSSLDKKIPWQSPLCPKLPYLTIKSDASNMGWGAQQGERQTGGRWSAEEAAHRISYLELLAAFLAL